MRPRSTPQRLPGHRTGGPCWVARPALGGALLTGRLADADCRPTESDILSPLPLRFGAPFRSRLVDAADPATGLIVSGTVSRRLPHRSGALVEIWHQWHINTSNFTEVTTFYTNKQGRYPIPAEPAGFESAPA